MQIWLELITRELLFFALLLALGSGPASFLPERFGATVRVALAPVLGVCVGACLTVTLIYAFAAHETSWVVVAVALVSLAVGIRRGRPWRRPSLSSVGQVAVIAVVVLGAFSYPLAARHTVGPAGGYQVGDASGYMSEMNGEQRASIRHIERTHAPYADLSLGYWAGYAGGFQEMDVSALEANINPLLGLGSTETYTPFLIAVVLAGAFGAFAVVRYAGGPITWPAVLAGCLFAGPVFTEMLMDGSEAALTGTTLFAPIVLVGWEAITRRETATLVLFALLAAGLQTVYPLFVPCVVLGAVVTIAVLVARRLRRGVPTRREIGLALGQLAGVLILAAAFTPVAFERNVRYWKAVLTGAQSFVGLPAYRLPFSELPGWLLGSREFYDLTPVQRATGGRFFMAAVVPALLLGLIAICARRNRVVAVMIAITAGASILAYYTAAHDACGYCTQRNLIPVAALAVPAIALGIGAFAALGSRSATVLAIIAALGVVLAVGHESMVVHQRLENGSYLLDPQVRQTVSDVPAHSGPVELEGFSQGALPPMEEPDVYDLLDEHTHENVSQPTLTDDGQGLFYLGGAQPLGPSFKPNYRYVLTRLGSIGTDRKVLARHGPIALEERVKPLDVTITGGVNVEPPWLDPHGTPWVNGPLEFLVVGTPPGKHAFISLVFQRTVPVKVLPGPALYRVRNQSDLVHVCLKTTDTPPVQGAGVQFSFTPIPGPVPPQPHAVPVPGRGLKLLSMSTALAGCAFR
jgi:hypothetical protein